jgi:hypothetical protein
VGEVAGAEFDEKPGDFVGGLFANHPSVVVNVCESA